MNLEHLDEMRRSTILFRLTQRLLYTKWRDPGEEPKLHLFGQLKRIARQWLDTCLKCKGGTYPAQLMYQELADMACERITAAITRTLEGKYPVKAVLDPYNPVGSTMHVSFTTSKTSRWETDARRCHINWVILDSDWEAEFCRVAESHPRVIAYVKNHNLGLEVPYRYGSETRRYLPDFIVLVDDGRGADDPLHLIVEIKGYPYYVLADSRDGQLKEAEVTRTAPSSQPTRGDIRQGFVYERVPHITLKAIANNAEIDVIWEKFQETLEPLREQLNQALGKTWEEWEIPRDAEYPWDTKTQWLFYALKAEQASGVNGSPKRIEELLYGINHNLERKYTLKTLPERPADPWREAAKKLHTDWWRERIARQKEIDASIAAKTEFEYLYDKPYDDKKTVRVAGPFTVESLSPHRVLGVDENDELIDGIADPRDGYGGVCDFTQMILENLKIAGVQQAHKEDRIVFRSLTPWPGELVCAEGRYIEGNAEAGAEKRAAIFIGPEFGTVSRPDLVAAAREAGDADFDVLVACAFNYDAHSSEFNKLGRIPVLKARMNADLHMADDLKNTGKGNLFVIFGEPDIDILPADGGQIRVKVNGVDVFHPNTGEVRSDGPEGIACWFIDTDYNEESFFVRHAYFLGANDPYKSLKTTLKAEINEEAWASLNSDTSRPFDKPKSGRIAVKVINHLGDEVMKVFLVKL